MINTGYTLKLTEQWDLQLNEAGYIETVDSNYAIAQNVANALSLFTNDAYFEPEKGIPHFNIELGMKPNLSVFRTRIKIEAEKVDGVKRAEVFNLTINDRVLSGLLVLTLKNGAVINVEI